MTGLCCKIVGLPVPVAIVARLSGMEFRVVRRIKGLV